MRLSVTLARDVPSVYVCDGAKLGGRAGGGGTGGDDDM